MLIYDKNTPLNLSSFNNNGLGYLTDFVSNPKITEELNSKGIFTGNYKLEFEYSINGLNAEHLQELNYIKVNHDGKDQIFYIESVKKTLNKIYVYARHIFFLTKNGFLEDTRIMYENATTALDHIISNTQFNGVFEAYSDVEIMSTAYYIRKNLIEAIITADNSMLKNWNCDLELDNFIIKLLNQRGENKGVTIEYGKNLLGIEYSVDYSNIATRIMPQGANELLLPEKYIDSPLINSYPIIYYQHINFDDVEVDEETTEEEAQQILRDKVNELYANGADLPNINIKVNWQDVSKTEEYKDYQYFESIKLGDIVNIKFMGMNLTSRVIKTVWDCVQKKYIAFELGNVKTNLLQIQKTTAKREIEEIVNIPSILNKAQLEASEKIKNAMGGYATKTENEYLILDTGDIETAERVARWNINGLGFSKNGYNGLYETTITADGEINASKITFGTLNGELIKAGTIKANQISTGVLDKSGNNLFSNTMFYDFKDWSTLPNFEIYEAPIPPTENVVDYDFWCCTQNFENYKAGVIYQYIDGIWHETELSKTSFYNHEEALKQYLQIVENQETQINYLSGRKVQFFLDGTGEQGGLGCPLVTKIIPINQDEEYMTLSYKIKNNLEYGWIEAYLSLLYDNTKTVLVNDKIIFNEGKDYFIDDVRNLTLEKIKIKNQNQSTLIYGNASHLEPEDKDKYWLKLQFEGDIFGFLHKYNHETQQWEEIDEQTGFVDITTDTLYIRYAQNTFIDFGLNKNNYTTKYAYFEIRARAVNVEQSETEPIPNKYTYWGNPATNEIKRPIFDEDTFVRWELIDVPNDVALANAESIYTSNPCLFPKGTIDFGDLKLEYGDYTAWSPNQNEVYGRNAYFGSRGLEITKDNNKMFIDEDEIKATYKDTTVFDINQDEIYGKKFRTEEFELNGVVEKRINTGTRKITIRYEV